MLSGTVSPLLSLPPACMQWRNEEEGKTESEVQLRLSSRRSVSHPCIPTIMAAHLVVDTRRRGGKKDFFPVATVLLSLFFSRRINVLHSQIFLYVHRRADI